MHEEALDRLIEYASLLKQARLRFNFISRRSLVGDNLWHQHLFDSLRAAPELLGRKLADVGSGAGLPGIPLAIAYEDLEVTLIERSARRCDFLRHAKMRLNLDGLKIEEADVRSTHLVGEFDTAVARGLAKPDMALALLLPLVRERGRVLLFVGLDEPSLQTLQGGRSLRLIRPRNDKK